MQTASQHLSDEELLSELRAACAKSNAVTVHILRLLIDTEERRLYLVDACSSMFDYCVRRLKMSEGVAFLRLAGARAIRDFPTLAERVQNADLSLSTLARLRHHLTADNVEELADAVRGMSKRQVIEFLNARNATSSAGSRAGSRLRKLPRMKTANEMAPTVDREIEAVADMLYRLALTLDRAERDEVLYVRDMMMHRNPSGDLKTVVMSSVRFMRTELERQIHAATERPRRPTKKPALAKTGRIPAAVRREVFARDGHQCTYTNGKGDRCPATKFLELDHIVSPLHGGSNDPSNVRVRCSAHNLWHAENVFGKEYVRKKIHLSQLKSKTRSQKLSLKASLEATSSRKSSRRTPAAASKPPLRAPRAVA
jgi:5-methylcytosine-specific restriction endonuclease McrA